MSKFFDISIGKTEKICFTDNAGMFQTRENTVHYVEKDVPEEQVKLRTLELQKQAKVYLVNIQVLDRLKTAEQAASEIAPYRQMIEDYKKILGKTEVNAQ